MKQRYLATTPNGNDAESPRLSGQGRNCISSSLTPGLPALFTASTTLLQALSRDSEECSLAKMD